MVLMTTLFFVLVALTAIHCVYESILAPSLRFELRLKLFELRDELRSLKLEYRESLSDEIFHNLQNSLNATISRLGLIDLRILKTAHERFKQDENLRKRSERFDALIRNCPIPEVETIRQRHLKLIGKALLTNSGGWFAYLVPIFVAFLFADRIMAQIRAIFALPAKDIKKIVPDLIVSA